MKILYVTATGRVCIDNETLSPSAVPAEREAIKHIMVAKENTHIVYDLNKKHCELDAEKGDLIITFYEQCYDHPIIVVKNADWLENIEKYNKLQQTYEETDYEACDAG